MNFAFSIWPFLPAECENPLLIEYVKTVYSYLYKSKTIIINKGSNF